MRARDRLRIAIQKSGRLSEASIDLLARAGLSFRMSRDRLFCFGESLPVDLLLVRDDDIPGLIEQGVCEAGVVGYNVAREHTLARGDESERFGVVAELGFGGCRLSIAVPQEEDWQGPAQLAGRRIATSYPGLLGDYLQRHGVQADIVVLSGSVEIAPRLGTADLICDLVSSGATLLANQLKEVAVIMESEAVMIATHAPLADERRELLDMLVRRLNGVLRGRQSKLLLFNAPRDALGGLLAQLIDADPPTTLPLQGPSDRVAVQAICHRDVSWQQLEELKRGGASHLLVLPVEKMLV
ncbi:MAG: ATP phosphoribosyltransferase [Xanthomonadales bacterium]|nr:ATP phosphoribosyltransferase [Xanthomonadales bacterium]MCB1627755.1 ATP phosphoribosyltransferase [Xanthomonadales bacterium]